MLTPLDVQANRDVRQLAITWSDQRTSRFGFYQLRIACQCAGCVDENTGKRILDPARIPLDIAIQDLALVGNYALRITWSDGHNTGLYTWNFLLTLAE